MEAEIFIRVGKGDFIPFSKIDGSIQVREHEFLTVRIRKLASENIPEVFFEDYQIYFKDVMVCGDGEIFFESEASQYFKESFGHAFLRIDYDDVNIRILFDVLVKEESFKRVQNMLEYIKRKGFDLMKSCFSRSFIGVDMQSNAQTEPEALIAQAEKILSQFQSLKTDFLLNLRQRLVPALVPAWSISETNVEIDPFNVINNLDSLMPASAGEGQVFLKGRYFDFQSADIMSLQSSSDVYENHIVLGGFYSIRRKIQALRKELIGFDANGIKPLYGYESFSRLMLDLTAQGMVNRCDKVLLVCDQLIKLLEDKYNIEFKGELNPTITPYVRASKPYRKVFTLFSVWYQLGNPILAGVHSLMKLKSISKLYEMFVMIKLIDYFYGHGWTIEEVVAHDELDESVPSFIRFSKNGTIVKLFYDKKVYKLDESKVSHQDLVDVHHHANARYPYYHPDYIIRIESGEKTSYMIFDAKYSSKETVKRYSMQSLYSKYYERLAVYDRYSSTISNNAILSVLAIYAIPSTENDYYTYWPGRGVFSKLTKVPMVGAVGLYSDGQHNFDLVFNKMLEISGLLRN